MNSTEKTGQRYICHKTGYEKKEPVFWTDSAQVTLNIVSST